ncbi:hypothetical protein [uncultured Aquimarina sp.]|uniref:hypothetical protein n=1 Tax=uncultured Aquimarina sp. TaxID=575652 RepID=UPI00260D4C34|nr:hypothetical protein [uncultured Aquimarina sp.]
MIKYSYLIILVTVLFSCKSQEQEMEIRYTSLNDYDANYIFNLENNLQGLKKINNYVINEIKDQKHFVDSLKKSDYVKDTPKTFDEHRNSTSLSLTATDLYLYTPPGELSLNKVKDKNIVMIYELDEETFAIKNINIGDSYTSSSFSIKETKDDNQCSLHLDTEEFNLEALSQTLEKTKALNYQLQYDPFTYHIIDKQNKNILDIIYNNKGTSLLLNYK